MMIRMTAPIVAPIAIPIGPAKDCFVSGFVSLDFVETVNFTLGGGATTTNSHILGSVINERTPRLAILVFVLLKSAVTPDRPVKTLSGVNE